MRERVVLGVDGGGTKTDVCVATSTGEVIAFATGGGANWEGTGLEAVGDVLHRLITEALGQCGVDRPRVAAAAFCLAGVDWDSDVDRLTPHIAALGVGGPRVLTNDSFAALRAGTAQSAGCVSIAGTGGVAAGRDRTGRSARTMGVAIGEGAGAWGLVNGALAALAAEQHASGEATDLTPRLLEATGARSVPELFEGISRGTKLIGADLAVHVLDAAVAGDAAAVRIASECGAQHGRDVAGVARRLGMTRDTIDVVLAGSVHLRAEMHFRHAFGTAVTEVVPAARLTPLDAPPAAGAALLAMELIDIDVAAVHAHLCAAACRARSGPTDTGADAGTATTDTDR